MLFGLGLLGDAHAFKTLLKARTGGRPEGPVVASSSKLSALSSQGLSLLLEQLFTAADNATSAVGTHHLNA
jgi:hypothetical protein